MKKNNFVQFTIILLLVTLVGCGSDDSSESTDNDKTVTVNQPLTIVGTATDDDGDSSSDEVKVMVKEEDVLSSTILPTTSRKKSSVFMQKADNEAIKNSVSKLEYAYYYRPNGENNRWYISDLTILGEKVNVYSLMGFRNNRNGWATVGTKVASVDLNNETLTIGHIDDNPSYTYYDAGWDETTTNPIIQNDIELIRNQTVNIAWWFFKANGAWFIINKNGDIFKFITKTLSNGEKDIGWKNVDMGGEKPKFFMDNGLKKIKFETTNTNTGIISTYYNSSSRTVYLLVSSGAYNPKVYFAGKNTITGNCLGANTEVHMMDFQALTDVETNVKARLEAEAKARGVKVNLGVEGSTSSSYQTPSVYYYNLDAPFTKEIHYNVIAEQSGKIYSSGWLPDNGGGCTYIPNPLK
jgi:predicted small lipoprotein YifL